MANHYEMIQSQAPLLAIVRAKRSQPNYDADSF